MNVIYRKPSSHQGSHYARAMRILTAVILCVATAPFVTPAGPAAAVTIGGFEIDGDMVSSGALDWASPTVAPQPRSRDLVQSPLDDSFIAGSTSKELDPGNWDLQPAQVSPVANDVGDLYSFGAYDAATDHQYAFIGFERAAVGGSIAFNLELNVKRNTTNQNGVSVPNRSVGDILVDILAASGSTLIVGDVYTWTGRDWNSITSSGAIVGVVNTAPITDVDGNILPAGRFAELSIDLTALFPDVGSCPGISLQATNLRSRSSGSSITSTLKDWVDPGTITTPTSCGQLHIRKRDENGELVPGARFSVSPNPVSATGPNPFGVLDGGPNDPDGTPDGRIDFDKVRPGSYTVTESAPPAGYIGDPAAQTKPVTTGNTTTFTYVNRLGTVSWEKVDGVSGAHICCATFSLVKTDPPAQSFPGGVVDNGPSDTDPRDGFVRVEGLKTGSWTLTETAPPTNYALPTPVPTHTFTISAAHPNEVVVAPIQDPRLPGRITIVKTDATSGVPIDATFQLWRDNGDGAFNTPPGSDTPIGPPQSTTGGRLVYPDLDWGTYWVEETLAPTGYTIDPGSPFQVVVSAADRTMTIDVADPRVLSELSVEKLDATDDAPLAGAKFQLFHDLNPVGPGPEDVVVGACTTSLPTGTCAVSDLDFGRYYWKETQAPPGYDLPADVFSDPVTINAGNAGTTLPVRSFTDPRSLSRLVVGKLDATNQAPLDGAEFTLWTDVAPGGIGPEDTVAGSCITGANGQCAVEDLDFGTYYWEETAAPTGYQLPVDVFSAPITIDTTNAGTTLPVRSFNDPRILSELTVRKLDATDSTPLAGGVFELYLDRGRTGPRGNDQLIDECTTTLPDGECTISGLDFGAYFWKEVQAPPGYDLPADVFSAPVLINAGNAGTTLPVRTFRDPRATSRLVVEKLDATNQALLGGAEFTLWLDEDGNAGPPTNGDTSMGSCTTVPLLGHCAIPDLDFGTYYWEETAAPTGYDLPDDVFSAPITIDASNAGTVTTTQMMDPRTPGTLVVLKTDAGTDEPLADAEFTLWMDQDGNDGPPTTADEQMGTCTTALPSGSCEIDGLDFGVYYWEETTPPPGYELAADPFSAPIRVGPDGVRDVAYSAFADDRVVTALAVEKVDAADGAPLAGAEFTLFLDGPPAGPDAGDSVAGRCSTATPDGTCSVGGLDFGDYYWVETEAPAGYFLPDPPPTKFVSITPENAGEPQRVTFSDTRIGGLIVHKDQLYNGGSGPLRPVQGTIAYGVPLVYRVTVTSTGPGTNHDVHVSDYIPGYNPADTTSTTKATYVPGSQRCVDAGPCNATINRGAGLLTWAVGDLAAGRSRTVEFRAALPIPAAAAQQQPGTYTDTAWNQALAWSDENDKTTSNAVRAQARIQVSLVAPTGEVLPEEDQPGGLLPGTGGPAGRALIGFALLSIVAGSGVLVALGRRRFARA